MSHIPDRIVGPLKQSVELMVIDLKTADAAEDAVSEIAELVCWLEMWQRRANVRLRALTPYAMPNPRQPL